MNKTGELFLRAAGRVVRADSLGHTESGLGGVAPYPPPVHSGAKVAHAAKPEPPVPSSPSAPTQAWQVELSRGKRTIIEAIADEWRALCTEGPANQPFYRPEWIAAFLSAFDPDATLLLVTVRSAGRLRAVLPLVEKTAGIGGAGIRWLTAPVNVHSNRFDLVHGADDSEQTRSLIWEALAQLREWSAVVIHETPDNGALHRIQELAGDDGYRPFHRTVLRSPYLPLQGPDGPLDAELSHLPAKFRANLRRRRRKLEARGPVRLIRIEQADPAALARFYALERSGWKGRAGTAIACDPATQGFYDQVARAAAEFGYLSLYELWCGDDLVASHFGMTLAGHYFMPKVAYAEAFGQYSPGQLLMQEIVRQGIESKLMEIDLLGPPMPWKDDWQPELRPHHRCYIFRPTLTGQALRAATVHLWPRAKQAKQRLQAVRQR